MTKMPLEITLKHSDSKEKILHLAQDNNRLKLVTLN